MKSQPIRIALAGVFHETNTFAPGTTELDAFQKEWFEDSNEFIQRYKGTRTSMGAVIDFMNDEGVEIIPGFYTETMPSGMISSFAAERIITNIVESIDHTLVDGLILILHGAMVSENIEDIEGEILKQVRQKVGKEFPIAITLDLHANISPEMIEYSDVHVGYDTYPHVDIYERAEEAVQLLLKYIRSEVSPASVLEKTEMLVVPQTMVTSQLPMKELMDKAFEIEKDPKVLNVIVAGGFPYSDVYDAGMAFVVTTDGDENLASKYANDLKSLAWETREKYKVDLIEPSEAVLVASRFPEGPVVLIEGSDNVGGGSPADATHTLKYLEEVNCRSLIVIRDREAVLKAMNIGVGKPFEGFVGGKADSLHGEPVCIKGNIKTLFDGEYSHIGPYMTGKKVSMGLTAVIDSDPVTVILTEERVAPWDLGHVSSVGLDANDFQIIVVKSAVAWKTAFGPLAKHAIDVDTPGCCAANLEHFDYKNIKRPIYPLDRN